MTRRSHSGNAAIRANESRFGLPRSKRLTQTSQFADTYEQRQCCAGRLMRLWVRRAPDSSLRLGVVASKRVGNAPRRARAKRLLREAFRINRHRFVAECDIVMTARYAILDVKRQVVEKEMLRLAARMGALMKVES